MNTVSDRAPRLTVGRRIFAALALLAGVGIASASTFIVTSTADIGGNCTGTPTNCTLRQAIASANATVVADVINFNIPGSGPHVITPATALPAITRGLTLNGYSQPGSVQNTSVTGFNAVLKIRISGTSIPAGAGLSVTTNFGGVTIQGLSITDFDGQIVGVSGRAIEARSLGNVSIRGCAIGATPSLAAAGNVIGVLIGAEQTSNVSIGSDGSQTVISNNRNLIADNAASNIVAEPGAGAVSVLNNLIGTHPSANTHLGTQGTGVNMQRAGAIIRGNIIKGSTNYGIALSAADFLVTGNTIGRVDTDTFPGTVSNGVGIRVQGSASGRGTIGGEGALMNRIHRNVGDSIEQAAAGIDADLALNHFINSGNRPIDLLGIEGLDPNDPDDPDSGPNGLQNSPVLTSATRFANEIDAPITITGSLNSLPNRDYRILFYVTSIGTFGDTVVNVHTDANGDAVFGPVQMVFPGANVIQVTANATLLDDVSGTPVATSEMSIGASVQTLTPPATITVNSNADPGDGNCDASECTLREAILLANSNNNPGFADTINFAIPGAAEQVHTIQVLSPLPAIDQAVTIDGYSQSGATPNDDASGVGSNADLKIVVSGGNFHFSDFASGAPNVTVRGLSITGFVEPFTAGGLSFTGSNARVEGCWFGVRPDGTEVRSSLVLIVQSTGGSFGGDSPAQRNVFVNERPLSLNRGRAVNNLFGVLPDGRTAATVSVFQDLNNDGSALTALGAIQTLIERNVFSTPISVVAIKARTAQILDNAFGESWDGVTALPLGSAVEAHINTVIASESHNIRGALNDAVVVNSSNLTGPILLDQPIVGGLDSGVSHHFGSSLSIRSPIFGTAMVGIDLNIDIPEPPFGVTLNDIHPTLGPDPDIGGNGLQNYPVLATAFRGGGTLTVTGTLPSLASQNYRILLCASTTAHASGHGGCEVVLDEQTIVTTDGTGHADFLISVADDPAYQFVTATAARIIIQDAQEETSEYSPALAIMQEPALFADGFE
jgi:CSLREA domain-containing protein